MASGIKLKGVVATVETIRSGDPEMKDVWEITENSDAESDAEMSFDEGDGSGDSRSDDAGKSVMDLVREKSRDENPDIKNAKLSNLSCHKHKLSTDEADSMIRSTDSNSRELLTCSACGLDFTCSDLLWKHFSTHADDKEDEEHHKTTDITSQPANHTSQSQSLKCTKCYKIFPSIELLQKHLLIHGILFKCMVCCQSFETAEILIQHIKTHSSSDVYTCPVCVQSFHAAHELKKHMKMHDIFFPDGGENCRILLPPVQSVKKDVKEESYICSKCGGDFQVEALLNQHVSHCTIAFKSEEELANYEKRLVAAKKDRHKKEVRVKKVENEVKRVCNVCGQCFNLNSGLKRHMRIHTGEKPFPCPICNKYFNDCGTVKKHLRTHTGERPYKCKICGRGFTEAGACRRHVMRHTGERPLKCTYCERAFVDVGSMRDHLKTHTGERPFPCEICGKPFMTKSHRNSHKRTHTGEKPEVCLVCHERFAWGWQALAHVKVHCDESKVQCLACPDMKFDDPKDLNVHMRSHKACRKNKTMSQSNSQEVVSTMNGTSSNNDTSQKNDIPEQYPDESTISNVLPTS